MNEEFDIKAKRISILDTYGENFLNKNYIYILYVKAYSYYIFFGTILLSLIWKGRKR